MRKKIIAVAFLFIQIGCATHSDVQRNPSSATYPIFKCLTTAGNPLDFYYDYENYRMPVTIVFYNMGKHRSPIVTALEADSPKIISKDSPPSYETTLFKRIFYRDEKAEIGENIEIIFPEISGNNTGALEMIIEHKEKKTTASCEPTEHYKWKEFINFR